MVILNILINIFKGKSRNKPNDLDSICKQILFLDKEQPSKKRDAFDIKTEKEELYRILSEKLFDAVEKNDFNSLIKVLSSNYILKSNLVNERGYNIIEYSLFNGDNDLFKKLLLGYYSSVAVYFTNVPLLFSIVLNRKNIDMIEFFLTNKVLSNSLNKENITNCFFNVVREGRSDLSDIIVKQFINMLDTRNIEASMIYFVSNNQNDKLREIFKYTQLIEKFPDSNIQKMLTFSIINRNVDALEIMVSDDYFIRSISNSGNIAENIFKIARELGSVSIIDKFINNNILKNHVDSKLKIDNK